MLFKHIYDPDLAQGSYLIGCEASGEALVVDPRRDTEVYEAEAAQHGLRIVAVTETHIHADYLSGALELSARTGATLHLSAEGGSEWRYGPPHAALRHGDEVRVGRITLRALHTPGHSPEHLAFLVTDGALSDEPGYLLSGDFVFVGDLGRPDLLDEVADARDTRLVGAWQLFDSLERHFLSLPDHVQVWPGHGAGSACGKSLGSVPSTTAGYERRVAWWAPYLQGSDASGFASALLEGQPDAPAYFGRMKRHNRAGPPRRPNTPLEALSSQALRARLGDGLLLVDTRSAEASRGDVLRGALRVPAGRSFASYAAYAFDPERDARELILLAPDADTAEALRGKLARVGIDRVAGFVTSLAGLERDTPAQIAPDDLSSLDEPLLLDVRSQDEYAAGHLPGARQLQAGRVLWQQDELPRDRPIVTYCQSGARSSVVASALRAAGFDRVFELTGSYAAWSQAGRAVSH